ncbi:hypothetical protein MTR67_045954 [Solanum verrucosum]|uniref:Uncharacterized protein n=1 Tax=Solanum verrucosum TaxID=315347 RepID=A0AAF0UVM2_SOLVR|nr:hypothetical protein MTR67_045954 [Solanum verrucosum]
MTAQLHKQSGGLGIRNLGLQNRCLLSKWLWRFNTEEQALWREVIVNKYGLNGNWVSSSMNSTYGMSAWRIIRKFWPALSRHIVYKVGNGTKIIFWKENWNGNETLMALFPDRFSLCTNPEETVAEVWSTHGWNIVFRRPLNDWETGRVAELLHVLNGVQWVIGRKRFNHMETL